MRLLILHIIAADNHTKVFGDIQRFQQRRDERLRLFVTRPNDNPLWRAARQRVGDMRK